MSVMVILIIDYDYEIQMEGLDNVIYGNFGEQLTEILQAMDNCGTSNEADVLRQVKAMTPEEYDEKYNTLLCEFA